KAKGRRPNETGTKRGSSNPRGEPLAEPAEIEKPDARIIGDGGPRLLRVVAPGSEEQAHVRAGAVAREHLERLHPLLDEPQTGTPAVGSQVPGDEHPQVLALMCPGLFALNGGKRHTPGAKDAPGELALFRGDEHGPHRLGHQAAQLRGWTVRDVSGNP